MGKAEKELGLTLAADGLKWPDMPVFATKLDERLHRKQRLAAAYRIFAHYGLNYGVGDGVDRRTAGDIDRELADQVLHGGIAQ